MKYRKFGRTGWNVSEIGFGGWGIGQAWWGPTNDKESMAALKTALDSGINFFDTAYVYGDGHSEDLIGTAIKGTKSVVATKIPPKNHQWPAKPSTPLKEAFPADWIISCTERSLSRLKLETVDLTQFHVWTDAWLNQDEWKEAVTGLKKQGKIKAFGVSINDHDPESALQLVSSGLVDSVQVIFNIFDQSPAKELLPLCLKHGVAVIARVPFDEGSLTGTLTVNTKFEGDDFRQHYFRGDHLRQAVDRVEKLKVFIGNGVKSLSELALKFILCHDAVSVVIPGMRTRKHVSANVQVSQSAPLNEDVWEQLKAHAWERNFYGW